MYFVGVFLFLLILVDVPTEGLQSELALLRRHESEKIFGVQIAGGDVAVMSKVACLKALSTFFFFG